MVRFQEFDEFDKMWMSYRMFKREATIPRSGYYLCKIYPEPRIWDDGIRNRFGLDSDGAEDFNVILERFESDLEHSAGVAHIVMEMAKWFPELFPDPYTAVEIAMKHDIGEIYIGDIADDGNPLHAQKEDVEQAAFLDWLYTQPKDTWEDTFQYYLEFQDKSTPRGQLIYIADKIEAILQLLNYELLGCYGDVRSKDAPTDQDLASAEKTGTYNATDVWAYHFKSIVVDQFDLMLTLPFVCLLDSAVTDVRGEWFPWWTFEQQQKNPLKLKKTPAA